MNTAENTPLTLDECVDIIAKESHGEYMMGSNNGVPNLKYIAMIYQVGADDLYKAVNARMQQIHERMLSR